MRPASDLNIGEAVASDYASAHGALRVHRTTSLAYTGPERVKPIGADLIHMQFRWRGRTIKTDHWIASRIVDAQPEMPSTLLLRADVVSD